VPSDSSWTLGEEQEIEHLKFVSRGGYGEVHKLIQNRSVQDPDELDDKTINHQGQYVRFLRSDGADSRSLQESLFALSATCCTKILRMKLARLQRCVALAPTRISWRFSVIVGRLRHLPPVIMLTWSIARRLWSSRSAKRCTRTLQAQTFPMQGSTLPARDNSECRFPFKYYTILQPAWNTSIHMAKYIET